MSILYGMLAKTFNLNVLRTLAAMLQDSYDLIVIDDEMVPLSATMVKNYYILTMCTILMFAMVAALIIWAVKRKNLCDRLMELREINGNDDKSLPLSIRAVKDEILSEETIRAAEFV